MTNKSHFDAEWDGNVLVWKCRGYLTSLTDADPLGCLEPYRQQWGSPDIAGVVIDLGQAPYLGSLMLEALRTVWNELNAHGKGMALCNVGEVARDILRLSRFDILWPICNSLEEAVGTVRGHVGSEQFGPRDVLA